MYLIIDCAKLNPFSRLWFQKIETEKTVDKLKAMVEGQYREEMKKYPGAKLELVTVSSVKELNRELEKRGYDWRNI